MSRIRLAAALLPLLVGAAAAQEAAKPEPAKPAVAPVAPPFAGLDGIRKSDGIVVHYYHVNYVDAAYLKKELERWKTPKGLVEVEGPTYVTAPASGPKSAQMLVPLAVPPQQMLLRIEDAEDNWPVMRRVLDMVDVPQLQVYVEAKIAELVFEDEFHFGAEVHLTRPLGDTFFQSADALPNRINAVTDFTAAFRDAGKRFAFDYIVDLVEQGVRTNIVSRPGVYASQGETAVIRVGDSEPIVTQTLSGTSVTATTIFKDVGLRLEVQPLFIGRDGVRARISAESSRVSEFRKTATSNDLQVINPVISTRSADTVVTVPDNETLVIGGLDQISTRDQRTGIPLLMDIPLLGAAFGSTTQSKDKTELVFFLTFRILTPTEARIVKPPSEKERTGE